MLCAQQGIRVCGVSPEQYGIPLGILAGGTKEQQEEYRAQCPAPEAFEEEMMVFAFLSDKKLNQFLQAMRKNKLPRIPLKAVLTEHNAVWDSAALCRELRREEEAMKEMKKSGNQES